MGRGNRLPSSSEDYEMFYIEYPFLDDGVIDTIVFWKEVKTLIFGLLDKKIYTIPETRCWINEDLIIAYSKTVNVLLMDNEWSMGIAFQGKPDCQLRSFSFNTLNKIKKKLYDNGYHIYERSGPWTSERWYPEENPKTTKK